MESRESYNHLILVCGHATYIGDGQDLSESQWLLQSFQKSNPSTGKRSEHETFIEHILAGSRGMANDPESLLVFSGGRTAHPDISEAAGYLRVLHALESLHEHDEGRISLEEHATDSYQNLLFSILLYRRRTGTYPEKITVITHAFKDVRFLELHAPAIKWPAHRIRMQGINPPFTREELVETRSAEIKHGYSAFKDDWYGARGSLSTKREARGWRSEYLEQVMVDGMEPVVERLLRWDGGGERAQMFPEPLPWDE